MSLEASPTANPEDPDGHQAQVEADSNAVLRPSRVSCDCPDHSNPSGAAMGAASSSERTSWLQLPPLTSTVVVPSEMQLEIHVCGLSDEADIWSRT
jgi:hypothetical protein